MAKSAGPDQLVEVRNIPGSAGPGLIQIVDDQN